MTAPKLTKRQTYWLNHYNHCKKQDISFKVYCRNNNLSSGAFGHARKTLIKLGEIAPKKTTVSNNKTGFANVTTAPMASQTQFAQIILPGQIKIELPLVPPCVRIVVT